MTDPEVARLIDLIAAERDLAPSSTSVYRSAMSSFVNYMGGLDKALSASSEEAEAWALSKMKNRDSSYNPATKVSAVFSGLRDIGIIDWNPFESLLSEIDPRHGFQRYANAANLPEVKAILRAADEACANPASGAVQVMEGIVTILHVKYCIPHSSIAALRMRDYRFDATRGVLSWRKPRTKEISYVELNKKCVDHMARHLANRGKALSEAPLFASVKSGKSGGFYNAGTISTMAAAIYRKAGVDLRGRSLKLAVAQLAAESNTNVAEIQNVSSSISASMATAVATERDQMPLSELWHRLEMEIEREVPIASGSIRATEIREALNDAGNSETIRFIVTATGKLKFSVSDDE